MKSTIAILAAAALAAPSNMFCAGFSAPAVATTQRSPLTSLSMSSEDEDFMRWAKQSRSASQGDNLVELRRPLGLVLDEDDDGNVFVQTVAPRGNAARSGLVQEGDIVTMCSATFGDQMWSCRGVGLTRVLAAIRVRAGPTVSLVFENRQQKKMKGAEVARQAQAALDARERAQAKRDQLLSELENDEKKLKKGKFLGLF
jgi:C-terminal processing protease CtpA/Prc|eukprot:CAMPEP_0201714394 /NCGR_PEP_ID=MMETSP0593-20130828/900_1 /ASSEMBLY_ACC=CAM_ASM_000672 /TAXON_ID=267983 /ORGANISM="Skeletonema japonicum, Strain CCMP2506" /LENGTH=199 /DNA_ID=CAMNT_0048203671 /DNA_START=83 /DNA_END=682 /DNA_ORIENTATION=+